MNIHSVKTRFLGSYLALLILFIIQIPIIYFVVTGITAKFEQIDVTGSLRRRAVEITEVLNRHVTTGDEALEKLFQDKKNEYGGVISDLRNGTKTLEPMTEAAALEKLDVIEKRWNEMKAALDKGMDYGDRMKDRKAEVEASTMPMVEKTNEMIRSFEGLKDPAYVKYIDISGFERMRTMRLSYLVERFFTSYADRENVSREIDQTTAQFEETLAELKKASAGLEKKGARGVRVTAAVKAVDDAWAKRKVELTGAVAVSAAFNDNLTQLVDKYTPQMVDAANELTKIVVIKSESSAMKGVGVLAFSVVVSALIVAMFMWTANTQIIRPLVRIKEAVEGFTQGDLTKRANVKVTFMGREIKDEISSLGDSIDAMAGQMSRVLGRISESSSLLASASEQLSASSVQIEAGANKQSGQTGQVATAMEEMNATVVEVAKNAQQASESARGAKDVATRGGDVVRQATSAIKEVAESTSVTSDTIKKLGKSSEEIGTIVSVINDIADQTNLLALNAAIEAARAGDQGRGFAVVADEVRKLAERTTKATKEISGMITSIQGETTKAVVAMSEGSKKVEKGVKLTDEAGVALSQIVVGVQNVTDMISHMATSTEEQSATTDEINRNMESIAEVAKTNVNSITEVAKATGEMARLAGELKEMVSNFKLTEEDMHYRPAHREKASASRNAPQRQLFVIKDNRSNDVEDRKAADNT
ncbi:MAG: type IV pili methyl-accepting chemotaxis transducer N-terminal domain-containing protein [Deltaproteobacteria bacterium]|nr:type IV pili methyl-accepting chemotaxis transducer N-terminal domain-containing protein [Deltaproteobacteria bacterium]